MVAGENFPQIETNEIGDRPFVAADLLDIRWLQWLVRCYFLEGQLRIEILADHACRVGADGYVFELTWNSVAFVHPDHEKRKTSRPDEEL